MKLTQHDQSLEELIGVNFEWRLELSPDGKFIQVINKDGVLIAGISKDLNKVAHLFLTTPKLVDALSRCVIVLSNPEMFPQLGEITVNYSASVLKQCINDMH